MAMFDPSPGSVGWDQWTAHPPHPGWVQTSLARLVAWEGSLTLGGHWVVLGVVGFFPKKWVGGFVPGEKKVFPPQGSVNALAWNGHLHFRCLIVHQWGKKLKETLGHDGTTSPWRTTRTPSACPMRKPLLRGMKKPHIYGAGGRGQLPFATAPPFASAQVPKPFPLRQAGGHVGGNTQRPTKVVHPLEAKCSNRS